MVLEKNFLMMHRSVFQLELTFHVIYVNDLTLLLNVLMVKVKLLVLFVTIQVVISSVLDLQITIETPL